MKCCSQSDKYVPVLIQMICAHNKVQLKIMLWIPMNKVSHSQQQWTVRMEEKNDYFDRITDQQRVSQGSENTPTEGTTGGKNTPTEVNSNGMVLLGPNFSGPGEYDVICARGAKARNHSGNQHFRRLIHQHLEAYSTATVKVEKSAIVSKIIDSVRTKSPEGGFVKKIGGRYFEVGDHVAREVRFVLADKSNSRVGLPLLVQKVGQSFRDLLHTKYKSSTKAKMAKRKMRRSSIDSSDGSSVAASTLTTSLDVHPSKDGSANALSAEMLVDPVPHPAVVSFDSSLGRNSQYSAISQLDKQHDTGPTGTSTDALLHASLHSLNDENAWASTIGSVQALGLTDDAHIGWEYGPISFRRFEQSLLIDGLPEERITPSIFDTPVAEIHTKQPTENEMGRLDVEYPTDQWGARMDVQQNPAFAFDTSCLAFEQASDILNQSIRSFKEDMKEPQCYP